MLVLTHAALATIDELFRYKKQSFELEYFPGYTSDQWGIKAHNRPWIEEAGNFVKGQRIIEIGGAYSLLPKYLCEKYGLEAWIGDDFGKSTENLLWSRWGEPHELPQKYPMLHYVFEPFGDYSERYPSQYFDIIFSVSTLEHIPEKKRVDVFRDMNRCLRPQGRQLHAIDINVPGFNTCLLHSCTDKFPVLSRLLKRTKSEIRKWVEIIKLSGIQIATSIPNSLSLLDRKILVESPDVVYRFYPPNNEPKPYVPNASLLIVIENR